MGTQLVYKSIIYIYTCTRFFDITHDMGDTFFCVTGSPRLTLTLTQKPRLRISEPASGSMMLHIYSRWTNHTLRMPSEGRCASRDEGDHVVPGYHDSTASSQWCTWAVWRIFVNIQERRSVGNQDSRYRIEAKKNHPIVHVLTMARLKGPWKLAGSHLPRSIIL